MAISSLSFSITLHAEVVVPVQSYTVKTDTRIAELAHQSGLSVSALRHLNPSITAQQDSLRAGKHIFLPVSSPLFPPVHAVADTLPELGSDKSSHSQPNTGGIEQNLAQLGKTVGSQDWKHITGEQVKQDASDWVKNKAESSLQQEAQDLLGKFGKAQVSINVDDKGNFSQSSASLLTPIYDQGKTLVFSQAGVHNQDGRIIGNVGVGQRYDLADHGWLLGYNAFFDHDFSRNHNRLGLGAEAWTDNLKLAGNYYMPLSGWKDSPDFVDYQERPARGFDVRAQGYLPAYPQLGASLVYEHYYGNEVALFGKDNLQKNPSAVTVGVDYTPIPLVTLKASHKQGQGGKQENEANISLNYQIGTPLEKQLSPDAVAASRSLKGSRYDLVDRNYDIVLEYREKQVLSVDLAAVPSSLLEGDSYIMHPVVNSKYAITSIRWNGDNVPLSLKATQGNLNPQGWQITLPAWDSTPGASNIYHLSVTVTDEHNHEQTSNVVDILVGQQRSGELTILGVSSAPSSGLSTDVIHLVSQVVDQHNQPVEDKNIKPVWSITDTKTGKQVPLVDASECPLNGGNIEQPCMRVLSRDVTPVNGIDQYHLDLVSTLAGEFSVITDFGPYGKSRPVTIHFSPTGPESTIARTEIIAPDGSDLLQTHAHPLVGETYRVRFYNKANVNITGAIPPDSVHWVLDSTQTNPQCSPPKKDVDTGVTGYTFIPRTNTMSNSTAACGDQGYGIKVVY